MKCPACGYVSFDRVAVCGGCGAPTSPAPQPAIMALPGTGAPEPPAGEPRRRRATRSPSGRKQASPGRSALSGHPETVIELGEEDLDLQVPLPFPPARGKPKGPGAVQPAVDPSPPAEGGERGLPVEAPPLIDRVEEIPERFWAPAGAGLTRRAAALLIDLAVQAALLGLFLAGAALALERAGLEASALLSRPGFRAALLPLSLLAALVSLAYHVPCDAVAGRTPGKGLAGLEVRSPDGLTPTWGTAALRWFGGALGFACVGVGIAWALFEPRRRGWADLLSRTVIAARGVDNPRGGGYHAPAVQGRDSSAGRATD